MPDYGCAVLIDRNDLPKHLFGIPDQDLSEDLCAEPLAGPWFRLGACSAGSGRDKQGVENVVYRRSMIRRLNLARPRLRPARCRGNIVGWGAASVGEAASLNRVLEN